MRYININIVFTLVLVSFALSTDVTLLIHQLIKRFAGMNKVHGNNYKLADWLNLAILPFLNGRAF